MSLKLGVGFGTKVVLVIANLLLVLYLYFGGQLAGTVTAIYAAYIFGPMALIGALVVWHRWWGYGLLIIPLLWLGLSFTKTDFGGIHYIACGTEAYLHQGAPYRYFPDECKSLGFDYK